MRARLARPCRCRRPSSSIRRRSSSCEALDVPGCRRVAVHAVPNEIGHTTDFAGNHDRKAGAHGFVHGKPPGFVFRRQHKHVRSGIKSRQLRLIDKACEHDVVECMVSAESAQFLFKLSGTSHDHGKWAVRLRLQPSRGFEQITRSFAPRKFRCVKHRWPVCGHIISLANLRLLIVGQALQTVRNDRCPRNKAQGKSCGRAHP